MRKPNPIILLLGEILFAVDEWKALAVIGELKVRVAHHKYHRFIPPPLPIHLLEATNFLHEIRLTARRRQSKSIVATESSFFKIAGRACMMELWLFQEHTTLSRYICHEDHRPRLKTED